ncbi:MAG: hypothetical protein ACE37K_17300 [Planctomycetota bacterium]
MTFVVVGMVFASLAACDDPVVAGCDEHERRRREALQLLLRFRELLQ